MFRLSSRTLVKVLDICKHDPCYQHTFFSCVATSIKFTTVVGVPCHMPVAFNCQSCLRARWKHKRKHINFNVFRCYLKTMQVVTVSVDKDECSVVKLCYVIDRSIQVVVSNIVKIFGSVTLH